MTSTPEKKSDAPVSEYRELVVSDHIEAMTRAILAESCGCDGHWREHTNLGRAAIQAYRPAAQAWRNDALEAAAAIADRYGQPDVAADIRALITRT